MIKIKLQQVIDVLRSGSRNHTLPPSTFTEEKKCSLLYDLSYGPAFPALI